MSSSSHQRDGSRIIPPRTQADNLPSFREIAIPNVDGLSELSDLQSWITHIQLILGNLNLLAIISHHLPRPTPDHINYESWLKWSQLVRNWLMLNVEEGFSTFLRSIRPHLELADETYLMITDLLLHEEEDIESMEFIKLWSMRRDQFDDIVDHILDTLHQGDQASF
ncbi:Amino acid/polyamine transporter I [Penicillium concentricum]|uniref:Amino acid/polyamine transporter I n=1 Tax=Penicillium concentricum TaxID=293559 RepID=A0A9W9S4L9_9EURO|nr:Amino acid/polyamine transporter I [Penicillium concentricum]KAJ5371973.1 Amino acid/polyamine transporter I [Penicillium concentricum]